MEFKSPGQLLGTGLSELLRPGPVTFDGFGPVPIAPKLSIRNPRHSERKAQVVSDAENARVRTGKQVYPITSDGFGPVVTAPGLPRRERYARGVGLMSHITSQIKQSKLFARQNRYDVVIPLGALKLRSKGIYFSNQSLQFADIEATDWAADYYAYDLQEEAWQLMMYCDRTELPSYQFQMDQNRHYGPSFKIPHKPEYQDITMTFMCGSEMLERYVFETWMYLIMDPETNNFNYIDEYALDINIFSYPEQGNHLGDYDANYSTTLVEAYPIAINSQELSYEANNTIQKLQVTFTYKYAIPFTGKGSVTGRQIRGVKQTFGETVQQTPRQIL